MSALYESCGGCGAANPSERCFGCFHDFGPGLTAPSNANTSGLAPCPFCGGEAWLNDYEAKYSDLPPMSRAPQCRSCGASLGYLTTPAKATEAWNRRVTSASAQATIADLEARVEYLRGSRDGHAAHAHSEFEARVAAEARADRLADIVKLLDECIWFNPDTQNFEVNHDGSVEKARAALQQETQP